jgi:hypothetical protein
VLRSRCTTNSSLALDQSVRESSVQSTSAATLPDLGPTQAKGRLRGKQPKLNQRQEAHLVALFKGGEYSTAELADLFGVARSTVYRALERERACADKIASTVG